ncbi:macro domain-containing protein [Bacillus amyloliquefaciens]|uniref:macro domain-containing protein n=1 Tax=Bacillus amyloliquefaciens TaxID=1390 RepID=UPI001CD554E7|nr:macro domain-containing protein [Bacillus amyloliquefaciens]MCA1214831.1 macro domain-containing protein [Bacillus amyloliquefaciens]
MIKIINGSILNASEDIICHQVNCQGVMGAGLAKKIKEKYPSAYRVYKYMCDNVVYKPDLLGKVREVKEHDGKIIAHIFGQLSYGRGRVFTDYEALKCGLELIKTSAMTNRRYFALPYGIGCGLAGGNWNEVYKMIETIFEDYEVAIYKLD